MITKNRPFAFKLLIFALFPYLLYPGSVSRSFILCIHKGKSWCGIWEASRKPVCTHCSSATTTSSCCQAQSPRETAVFTSAGSPEKRDLSNPCSECLQICLESKVDLGVFEAFSFAVLPLFFAYFIEISLFFKRSLEIRLSLLSPVPTDSPPLIDFAPLQVVLLL